MFLLTILPLWLAPAGARRSYIYASRIIWMTAHTTHTAHADGKGYGAGAHERGWCSVCTHSLSLNLLWMTAVTADTLPTMLNKTTNYLPCAGGRTNFHWRQTTEMGEGTLVLQPHLIWVHDWWSSIHLFYFARLEHIIHPPVLLVRGSLYMHRLAEVLVLVSLGWLGL